jgi:signal peptidase I
LKILIIAAIASGLVIGLWIIGRFTFALRLFRMSHSANEPALRTGRFFFTSTLKKPRRFDLICYRAPIPGTGPALLTHRLCGVAGDIIEIKAGVLYVNKQNADNDLNLKHIYKIQVQDAAGVEYDPALGYTIPPYSGILYVPLEDKYVRNKNISCQQYILPPGLRDDAIFKVYRQNWNLDNFGPVKVPANKFFVMGDNRGNSMDSRHHGMIDRSKYAGTVLWK